MGGRQKTEPPLGNRVNTRGHQSKSGREKASTTARSGRERSRSSKSPQMAKSGNTHDHPSSGHWLRKASNPAAPTVGHQLQKRGSCRFTGLANRSTVRFTA